jgi:hypothetical protein
VFKLRRKKWVGHVACWEGRDTNTKLLKENLGKGNNFGGNIGVGMR